MINQKKHCLIYTIFNILHTYFDSIALKEEDNIITNNSQKLKDDIEIDLKKR